MTDVKELAARLRMMHNAAATEAADALDAMAREIEKWMQTAEAVAKVKAALADQVERQEQRIARLLECVSVGPCGGLTCVWVGEGGYVWGFDGPHAESQANNLADGIRAGIKRALLAEGHK